MVKIINMVECSNDDCNIEYNKLHSNHNFCRLKCRRRQYRKDNRVSINEYNRLNAKKPENYKRARLRQIEYNEKNKEYIKLRSKRYELINYVSRAKYNRDYKKETLIRIKLRAKSYYQENKEILKLQTKLYHRYNIMASMDDIKRDFKKYGALII